MQREKTETIKWRPSTRTGALGPEVDVEMLADDVEAMRGWWREIKRLDSSRHTEELKVFRLVMDAFAAFPGTRLRRDERPQERRDPPEAAFTSGRYHGAGATLTERDAGVDVEVENMGPLRPGGAGHVALLAFESGDRMTAYEASERATGDHHAIRREATRLLERGFLRKDGALANPAPRGREHVDAYRITDRGRIELHRLAKVAA